MFDMLNPIVAVTVGGALLVITALTGILFRRIVSTNTVQIVQRRHKTTPYGTGQDAGNVYYKWPSWVPFFGVTVIELPVSNFDLTLKDYEAYDKDRVPFEVDVTAFFRIADTALAAQRVADLKELREQLNQIVQGAVRRVLASDGVDVIMVERSKFGDMFTAEVAEQLKQWGVESVKSMELMDIRDGANSKSITAIMQKKISHISMESRVEVAKNAQVAKTAEIEAQQAVDVRQQEADRVVGERTAEKEKLVGVAKQNAQQEIKTAEAITRGKEMEVIKVGTVRQADITKEAAVVAAEQQKEVTVIAADGALQATMKHAEGVRIAGIAEGDAQTAILMAPVTTQISLAKEIGGNDGYQAYLVSLKGVEGYIAVGTAQAAALAKADIKVIANTGDAITGVSTAMQLFTPKGGTAVGGMLEALAQTPQGKELLAGVANLIKVASVPSDQAKT
jgi:flotillin